MYKKIKSELDAAGVSLVAVSKTKPAIKIRAMYNEGQRIFGENRVQELVQKYNELPADIEWHMIGHLQSKKVKSIISFVSLIHAVDSIKLLRKIAQEAKKVNRVVDSLIQFHIADEESKYGFAKDDIDEILTAIEECKHSVRVRGVMGMATFTDDEVQLGVEFATLRSRFDQMKANGNFDPTFDTVSMGMSGDYKIAIQEGSTMVRIGSLLFGSRN